MPRFEQYDLLTYPKYKMFTQVTESNVLLYRLRNPIHVKLIFEKGQKAIFCGFLILLSDVISLQLLIYTSRGLGHTLLCLVVISGSVL